MRIHWIALALGAGALAACGNGERTAQAETSVAEAEVSTTMPEAAVPDAQLEAAANQAAAEASQQVAASTATGTQTNQNQPELLPAP